LKQIKKLIISIVALILMLVNLAIMGILYLVAYKPAERYAKWALLNQKTRKKGIVLLLYHSINVFGWLLEKQLYIQGYMLDLVLSRNRNN